MAAMWVKCASFSFVGLSETRYALGLSETRYALGLSETRYALGLSENLRTYNHITRRYRSVQKLLIITALQNRRFYCAKVMILPGKSIGFAE